MAEPGEELIRRYLAAAAASDFGAIGEFAHDDLIMEWPQSGERFRGRDNVVAAVRAQTNRPTLEGEPRIVGAGDVWVVMGRLRYSEGTYHYVGVYELDAGRIRRTVEYFGEPFPAQAFRAQWLDRSGHERDTRGAG